MSRLQAERLEQKTDAIRLRADRCGGSWESALFVTMARNYGFGVNGDAFEAWAMSVPLQSVAHHRDDLFQIEAIFMGQAGLLEYDTIPEPYRDDAMKEAISTVCARNISIWRISLALLPSTPACGSFSG